MTTTVYTWGYRGRKLPELVADVARLNAVVADVRISPFSRDPTWTRDALQKTLGARYQWIRDLGNKNYNNHGPIVLVNDVKGFERLGRIVAGGHAPILLCACADWRDCHRATIAERLEAELGITVEHLRPVRYRTGRLWEE